MAGNKTASGEDPGRQLNFNTRKVSVHYGDSDGDITECNDAESCTPYRFMRYIITKEYYCESYNPGIYGESVVENSDC